MPSAMDLCSLAWAGQSGYVCLSLRDPSVDKHTKGYWKDVTFKWPDEATKIRAVLAKARNSSKDVYWAPAVFSAPTRAKEAVLEARMLWADLDEVDPTKLPEHLKPTAAWQTSPGRWQAIWQLERELKPAIQTNLNQRLTYAIGADRGGWDLTQVLRLPDTPNHKYPNNPKVELLWLNGHTVNPDRLIQDLPELSIEQQQTMNGHTEEVPATKDVLERYFKRLPARAKELIRSRHAQVGTRSDRLWELACLLAEQRLAPPEIVAITQSTVWNKFAGRHDELTRLFSEAQKAVNHVGSVTANIHQDENTITVEEVEDVGPLSWLDFDREHQPIRWLVADIWGESEVGFISGHPKSYKSWLALDLAVSVATGTRFLDTFQCKKHNVLLIQEEDPKAVLQDRLAKIGASKNLISAKPLDDHTFELTYALPENLFIISNQGFTINEEWLDMLEAWVIEREIKLVILDPLMMMGEGFDEFKAFEFMAQVLKPLKRLRARTQASVVVVHHHTKNSTEQGARAMYGSVALWAWEEAALHLQVKGTGQVVAERFSKHALLPPITVEIGDVAEMWHPTVSKGEQVDSLLDVLETMEHGATVEELEQFTNLGRDAITRQLKQLESSKRVQRAGTRRTGPGRPKTMWKVVIT